MNKKMQILSCFLLFITFFSFNSTNPVSAQLDQEYSLLNEEKESDSLFDEKEAPIQKIRFETGLPNTSKDVVSEMPADTEVSANGLNYRVPDVKPKIVRDNGIDSEFLYWRLDGKVDLKPGQTWPTNTVDASWTFVAMWSNPIQEVHFQSGLEENSTDVVFNLPEDTYIPADGSKYYVPDNIPIRQNNSPEGSDNEDYEFLYWRLDNKVNIEPGGEWNKNELDATWNFVAVWGPLNKFKVPNSDYSIEDANVTKFPYSSIVYYSKTYDTGGLSRGTGVVVGKDYVLTAGHVNNGWSSANIIPALKSNNTYPLGNWSGNRESSVTSPDYVGGHAGDDYALTKINPRKESDGSYTHIGDVVKPLTVIPDTQNKTFFVGSQLATLGYPSFKGHTQYFANYTVTGIEGDYRIGGSLNSSGGNSGAPLLNNSAQIVGIYHGGGGTAAMNSSTKIPLLLSWGLKDETSRIYFVKNKSEWDVKRKQINPEGVYIEKNNGQDITSNEFSSMANYEVSKIGYHVTELTDGVNSYDVNKNYTMFIGGLTLYPETYFPNNYNVVFDKNAEDATGEMTEQAFTYDEMRRLNKNNFVREGYTFTGWNTSANGTGDSYDDLVEVTNLSDKQNDTVHLYAQWSLNIDYSTLEVHDSTIIVGDVWNPLDNFDYAKDSAGNSVDFSSVQIIGYVNTNTPGNYKIVYSYNGLEKIATITVKEKEMKKHIVQFNSSIGGRLLGENTLEVLDGTKISEIPQPIANSNDIEDIHFLDWYQDGKIVNPQEQPITKDTTFTAKFGAAVYRLYNKSNGDHLLTKNKNEKNDIAAAGWRVETNNSNPYGGAAFYVPVKEDTQGKKTVYRIYNPTSGEHFYSTNKAECDLAVKAGWRHETNEDYTWVSDGDVKMYREFNPDVYTAGSHNFTTNKGEHEGVVKAGWKDESKDTSLWTVLKAGF